MCFTSGLGGSVYYDGIQQDLDPEVIYIDKYSVITLQIDSLSQPINLFK